MNGRINGIRNGGYNIKDESQTFWRTTDIKDWVSGFRSTLQSQAGPKNIILSFKKID